MATLEAATKTLLTGDATLMAILTGGLHDAADMDRDGWTLDNVERTPTGRIKPFGVVRWGSDNPFGPLGNYVAGRRFLNLWLYEDTGLDNIRAAKRRAKTLLHRQYFSTDNEGLVRLKWAGNLGEGVADELGGASCERIRFEVIYTDK